MEIKRDSYLEQLKIRKDNGMSCPTNGNYKYLENLIHYLVNMV